MKHFSCGDVVAGCRAVFSAVDESVRDHITNTAVSS
jgi:predicted small metal-binding protein